MAGQTIWKTAQSIWAPVSTKNTTALANVPTAQTNSEVYMTGCNSKASKLVAVYYIDH